MPQPSFFARLAPVHLCATFRRRTNWQPSALQAHPLFKLFKHKLFKHIDFRLEPG
jgi:hypothetical protein